LHKLKSIIPISSTFTHDTKAVIGSRTVVVRPISGHARGDGDATDALAKFFRQPVSHVFLLPASRIFGDIEANGVEWDEAVTPDLGDQVSDEHGRVFEIERSADQHFYHHQITQTY
jgi:hypothetical protein